MEVVVAGNFSKAVNQIETEGSDLGKGLVFAENADKGYHGIFHYCT